MKIYKFDCKLLADIVLTSSTATEGFSQGLDYIPGSKFLGIVAKELYGASFDKKEHEKIINLFHNGQVQFGNAYPVYENEQFLKVPLAWFHPKGASIEESILIDLSKLSKEALAKDQPKQARKGYFSMGSKQLLNPIHNFSIKSAYDSKKRRSKDSQMFGYFSIPQGTTWSFEVRMQDEVLFEEVKTALVGPKKLGRSKTSEYGLVDISFSGEVDASKSETIKEGTYFIYAKSDLCFYDDTGRNTMTPSPSHFNLPEGSSIDWSKSQLRTRLYQTWNQKRSNRDADRTIIIAGSVFCVNLKGSFDTGQLTDGVGAHKNEGFGQVLFHPEFLQSQSAELNLKLKKLSVQDWKDQIWSPVDADALSDKSILNFISKKKQATSVESKIDQLVNSFVKDRNDFNGIPNSQWGTIRNYCKNSKNEKVLREQLFAPDFGFCYRGQSEKDWKKSNRRVVLEKYLFENPEIKPEMVIPFLIKLSSEKSKAKNDGK